MLVKKELAHFQIDKSYGGSQAWMRDIWMRIGGCGALAAVDSNLFFTLNRGVEGLIDEEAFSQKAKEKNRFLREKLNSLKGLNSTQAATKQTDKNQTGMSLIDTKKNQISENPTQKRINDCMTRKQYCALGMEMKPYLSPRRMGINRLDIYVDGYGDFLRDRKVNCIKIKEYPMGCPEGQAWKVFKQQIDNNFLVPVLLLNPVSKEWKDFHWHWFLLNGYQEDTITGERMVKAVTFGEYIWLSWKGFWDEENEKNGGMILYS